MVVVVVVAASEALSIYTKSGPFVRGKELSEVALPEPPKKRKPPRTPPRSGSPPGSPRRHCVVGLFALKSCRSRLSVAA